MKNKIYLLIILLIPIIIIIGRSFALPINSEVKTIELNSDNYDNVGSFNIKKTVDWIESGKAEVTYTVKTIEKTIKNSYKDIVLVIDTSNSMNEGKLDKAKNDSQELIRSLLNDLNNRVALITFNNNATIKSNFTNNKEELETLLSSLNISNKANFNNALLKVNELLNNYDNLDNHELIVLFLTDGNPNEGMPNDKATYGMLKDKYQDIVINGIQYEKEKSITDEIKNISDNQFLVSDRNILNEAILTSVPYERFNIVDIINNEHFNVSSIDDIKVNDGNVELTNENGNQKINWNLSNIKSGVTSTMKVTINLNSTLINQSGLYKVNNTTTINSKLEGESEKTLTSDKTLLLKNKYNVTYDLNKPGNCDLDSISAESHFVGDIVTKKTQSLYCDGYVVKSWEIKGEDNLSIKNINSSSFMMPSSDITIRAVWAKNGIVKSMDGAVLEKKNTLYRVLQEAAIDGTYAKEYTGPHQDSNTQPATKNIYHWYAKSNENEKGTAITNMYHVKFANRCWRMIRTTDIGGVRLLYNGEYDDEKKCGTGRLHKVDKLFDYSTMSLTYRDQVYTYSDYYFADDYTYNADIQKNVLTNPEKIYLSPDTYENVIGKYTCYSYNTTECANVYKVIAKIGDYSNSQSLLMIYPTSYSYYYTDSYYGTIISSSPSFNYGTPSSSIAGTGYMYGDNIHTGGSKSIRYNPILFADYYYYFFWGMSRSEATGYVSDTVREERKLQSNGSYYTYYYFDNPTRITSISDYSELIGKYYTSYYYSSTSSITPYYIIDVDDQYIYYVKRPSSSSDVYEYSEFTDIYVGESTSLNDDGTYTIGDGTFVKPSELRRHQSRYVGKIICFNGKQTCFRPVKIRTIEYDTQYSTKYFEIGFDDETKNILIAKSRDGLVLSDTLIVDKDELINNFGNYYNEYKYTCGNMNNICTEENLSLLSAVYQYDYYGLEQRLHIFKNEYYFGSNVTWDGTKYTLVDPVEFEVYKDNTLFSNHHFMCLNTKTMSCENVAYIVNFSYSERYDSTIYYILLENGETDPLAIFNDMIKKNTHDSLSKAIIDEWYSRNMAKYTSYLEDSVYCNNRKPVDEDNGWFSITANISVGYITNNNYTKYEDWTQGYSNNHDGYDLNLKCEWETDRFSMDNPKAKLKYPVALLTYDEMALLHNSNARRLTTSTYSLTTTAYSSGANNIILVSDGRSYTSGGYPNIPAITLKYGTEYIDGDGSATNPYVVDTSEVDG